MKKYVFFVLFVGIFFSGCYEDKGEYAYTPLNWVDIDYLPSDYISINDNEVIFQYRQPLTTSQEMSLVPVVRQDLAQDESELSYYWINPSGAKDTLEQKEFRYQLLPGQETKIKRLLKITDHATDIDYYRNVEIQTVPPYKDQWFVLHGDEGDRRLGAAENMEGRALVTLDCYETQYGQRRFRNAIGLAYASMLEVVMTEFEVLQIFERDSCFSMYPFQMKVNKVNEELFANIGLEGVEFQEVVYSESWAGFLGIRTNIGLMFAAWGKYNLIGKEEGINNYHPDKMYIAVGGYGTLWDDVGHRFLSYKFQANKVNKLALVNQKLFEGVELGNKKCLALLASTSSPNGCMAIMRDDEHTYWYEINQSWSGGTLPGAVEAGGQTFRQDTLKTISLDEHACFAANKVFSGQFFYSDGSKIYRYNMVNQENMLLYDAQGGTIEKMVFKSYYPESSNKRPEFTRVLGVVVNYPDGKGEVHEVSLTNAGEVENSIVYRGFGKICDLVPAKGL